LQGAKSGSGLNPDARHGAGCRAACARFDKIGRIGVFLEILSEKRLENLQKLQIRRHNARFPPKSSCRLRLSSVPHNAYPAPHRTCRFAGTGNPFLFFDPAETT
jgi:hypothetical protein